MGLYSFYNNRNKGKSKNEYEKDGCKRKFFFFIGKLKKSKRDNSRLA